MRLTRRNAALLGFTLLALALSLPIGALVWQSVRQRRSAGWQRYSDRQLQLSWSAPAGWTYTALRYSDSRTLVLESPGSPRAVLYLSATSDPAVYRSWDPAAANTIVAGLPASDISIDGGQNPPQRLVSFRHGDRLVTLTLLHEPAFDQAVFDRILGSVSARVEEGFIRLFTEVDSLVNGWDPCRPDCGLSASSPNWCSRELAAGEWGGVDVFSNGSNFPYFYENECPDFYGLKFQCVELIQRYYWEVVGRNTGTGSPAWGIASAYQAWWKHPPEYEAHPNGSGSVPQRGDILIWRPEGRYAPHGHIGIVLALQDDKVVFVHQNSKEGGVSTRPWYNGWIDDPYLYGWLRLSYGDHMPPDGDITAPEDGSIFSGDILRLEGWAEDSGTGLAQARFHAIVGETVVNLGEPFASSPFRYEWDLAAAGIPDGPVTITLSLRDKAGNISYSPRGTRQVILQRAKTPTPLPTLPASDCRDLVANGSFELNRNWLLQGESSPRYAAENALVGNRALQLGILDSVNIKGVSIAQQIIAIPENAATLRLSFYYYAQAAPTDVNPQRVVLLDQQGTRHVLLLVDGPYSISRAWREAVFDENVLGQFRGQRVRLQFQVYNNGWEPVPASLLVDDIRFMACR